MKIELLVIGKTAERYLKEGVSLYIERLTNYCSFTYKEISAPKLSRSLSIEQVKKAESELLLKEISPKDRVVLLDERGDSLTSLQFASLLQKEAVASTPNLLFIVGGAYGFDPTLYKRANQLLSLSTMTLSHQMVRLFFVEQLYRAFTIIKGEPYHHK